MSQRKLDWFQDTKKKEKKRWGCLYIFEKFFVRHWDEPEGWDGEGSGKGSSGWGTHVHPWLIHVNVWQKAPQFCKVISILLK